jgi:hypothetical protein
MFNTQNTKQSVQWQQNSSMLTDRQTGMTTEIFAFRHLERAPKKWLDNCRDDDDGNHVLYIPEKIPIRGFPEKNKPLILCASRMRLIFYNYLY